MSSDTDATLSLYLRNNTLGPARGAGVSTDHPAMNWAMILAMGSSFEHPADATTMCPPGSRGLLTTPYSAPTTVQSLILGNFIWPPRLSLASSTSV